MLLLTYYFNTNAQQCDLHLLYHVEDMQSLIRYLLINSSVTSVQSAQLLYLPVLAGKYLLAVN